MFPKTRQQAWINGLPNMVREGGIPLEILPFPSPKPGARSLSLTIFASAELISKLQSLSKDRTKIPKLSLVVRVDAARETDYQYLTSYAVIDTVVPNKDMAGAFVTNILFQSITMTKGVSMQPGPPAGCPPVQPTGVNTGWIFGLPHEDIKSGKPLEIIDFTPPRYDRRLTVTLGKPSIELKVLAQKSIPSQELILVLPDRATQRYVEFKLWDTKVTIFADESQAAFESDIIECLTGEKAGLQTGET